jgi:ATP-binding cassette subfamily C (CFTR/MRP) protein 1
MCAVPLFRLGSVLIIHTPPQIIRAPLIFFPFVFAALTDALVALGRIGKFLTSEDLPEPYPINNESPVAVSAHGDFVWETVAKPADVGPGKFSGRGGPPGIGGGRGKGVGPGKTSKKEALGEQKDAEGKEPQKKWWKKSGEKANSTVLPSSAADVAEKDSEKDNEKAEEKPFELRDLDLTVPRGAFIGIVGRVGSGKVSVSMAI